MSGFRICVLAASALALAGAAGCGGSDEGGGEEAVVAEGPDVEAATAVANDFFTDGLTRGDVGACALLTPEAEKAFAGVYPTKNGTCQEGIDFLANQGNPSKTLYDIESVEVDGDTATVTFGIVEPAELTRSGDTWLISKTGLEG